VLGVLGASRGLRVLAVCDLAFGVSFGAIDVAVPAIATARHEPALAGVPLAALALGGVCASLWSGAGARRQPAARRYVTGAVIGALFLPLCLIDVALAPITIELVVVGAGISLTSVALFELLDHVVSSDRGVEAMSWISAASGVGAALGAAVAGPLTHSGSRAPLAFACVGTLACAIVAVAGRRTLRSSA
jgi:MFS family permease